MAYELEINELENDILTVREIEVRLAHLHNKFLSGDIHELLDETKRLLHRATLELTVVSTLISKEKSKNEEPSL